jgi:acyl carrier protein
MNVPIEQLDDDSSPDTVANWDSLKHMNLILALEEEFAVAFSDDEVVEMLSVKSIVEILSKKQPRGSAMS